MKKLDYIVVGGGISGLSAAWKLEQQGLEGLVLEASTHLGGCLDSVCTEGLCQELGAHSAFNSYGGMLEIIKSLESPPQRFPKQKASFLVFKKGQISSVMKNLSLVEMALSVWKLFVLKKNTLSIKEYYGSLVGPKNYQTVIRHALASVTSQNVDAMPADFLFQKRPRDKSFERKFSFVGGMSSLITKIAKTLETRVDSPVSSVEYKSGKWVVSVGLEQWVTDKLVLAVPAKIAAKLLQKNQELALAFAEIDSVTLATLAVSVKDKDIKTTIDNCAGWIGIDADFYSMISTDPVSQKSRRGFTFHFKPEAGSIEERKQKVIDLIGTNQDLVWHEKTNTLPKITRQHHQKIAVLEEALSRQRGLAITGNYFLGMAIEDCIQRSFSEVARLGKIE